MFYATTKIDFTGVHAKFDEKSKRNGRQALADQIISDCHPFVPKQEGFLRNAVSVSLDGAFIFYNMQYAGKQYRTQFSSYTTIGTGPYWDRKAKAIYGRSWPGVYARGSNL